jgi:hypothetical protein
MMTGKAKIEGLTNSWYGFAVFSAICSVLMNGIGFFSIGGALVGLVVSWIITFCLGKALLGKSSFTRAILILLSGLLTVLGTLGVAKMTWTFVQTWQLSVLAAAAYSAVNTWMNAKSFRTLTDSSVKAYFG